MPPEATTPTASAGPAQIRIETNPAPQAWDAYVQSSPDASIFHERTWHRALERSFRAYRPSHRMAWRGERVCGVLPLYRVPSLPFGCALISTPLGVYGGICADDEEAAQALLDDATAHAKRIGARYVELRQERPLASLPTKELYVCFRRILHADREANLMAVPGKERRIIRLAEGHGLTHRMGGMEILPAFYEIYSINMRNLGSPAFPRHFFKALLEEYGTQCSILGVYHGAKMVAGVFTFYYRDRVMPYYAASIREALALHANHFMYWTLTCDAAERGFRVFDFGRSKKDSGSYHFKRHWGYTPIPLPYQYQLVGQRKMPNLSPTNPTYGLVIRAWQRAPLPLTRWLGPMLSPYFP